MAIEKLPTLKKWFLKYTNKKGYKQYKQELWAARETDAFAANTTAINHPNLKQLYKPIINFKHSGNSGDIIYSLPAVLALAGTSKINFYLHENQPAKYEKNYHPLGTVMLNNKMIQMLVPLLAHQPQFGIVEKFSEQEIDYDLDTFRNYNFYLDRGSITHWYFNVYGVGFNTGQPWLTALKDESYSDTIVIARSHRYRMPLIDYSFLRNYPNTVFLGVEEEFKDMKQMIPDLVFKPVTDFLEMATIINSCRFFIGNQSFPFSLAEALKVTRLLEVYYKTPNVVVTGKGANDFMYQPQFEFAVQRLYNETAK